MKLDSNFTAMLDTYSTLTGAKISQKILSTCTFIEHVISKNDEAAVEIPCGAGKSTWAHAHIANNASAKTPYVYVVPTRSEVLNASALLAHMRGKQDVGMYLGWNHDSCKTVSGCDFTFDRCLRTGSRSECRRCRGRKQCLYMQSIKGLRKPVIVMTRESFLMLCEKRFNFSRHTVICDEDLSVFSDERFTLAELRRLEAVLCMAGEGVVAKLVKTLFPGLAFWKSAPALASAVSPLRIDVVAVARASQTIRRYSHTGDMKRDDELLVFRFLLFFRTAAECNATYGFWFDGEKVIVKKNRIDLRGFTAYRKLIVLNATASLSLVEMSGRARIWRCPDLEPCRGEGKVSLYVIPHNPTKSRAERNTTDGLKLMADNAGAIVASDGTWILVACNREDEGRADRVETELKSSFNANVLRLSRGFLRGTNSAKMCTVAFLPAAGFFSTLADCALHAALRTGMDFPWSEVIGADGRPRMFHGRFINPLLQDIYMRKTITEFYQGIYRTAVRDGGDVAVVIPLPDADWITALWRLTPFVVAAVHGAGERKHRLFSGIGALLGISGGTKLAKKAMAEMLGYSGAQAWKRNKRIIMDLMGEYYADMGGFLVRRNGI